MDECEELDVNKVRTRIRKKNGDVIGYRNRGGDGRRLKRNALFEKLQNIEKKMEELLEESAELDRQIINDSSHELNVKKILLTKKLADIGQKRFRVLQEIERL